MKFEYWYRKKRGFGVDKDDIPFECDTNEIGKAIDTIYFGVNKKHLNESVQTASGLQGNALGENRD